jgi:N-acetylneuraminic acid mutarotase
MARMTRPSLCRAAAPATTIDLRGGAAAAPASTLLAAAAPLVALAALAVGCSDGGSPTPPLPDGWTELPAMPAGFGEAAAAAWGGKIYVAGGYDTASMVQIFDVARGAWQTGTRLPRGTDNAGAAVARDRLYVVGGEGAALFIYDAAADQWSLGPAPPRPRFASAVELIGDELHLVGGWSFDRANNVSVATHDVYDVVAKTYRERAAAPTARNHALSGVIDGKLYVTGGRGPGHEGRDASNLTATEVYDPATDSWERRAALPTPRSGGAAAVLGGKLYVLGGGLPGDEVHAVVERYDPATDSWERLGDLPVAMTGQRAVAVDGSLYVVGGFATSKEGRRIGSLGSARAFRYTPERP